VPHERAPESKHEPGCARQGRSGSRAQDRRGRRGGQVADCANRRRGRSGAPFVVLAVHDEIRAQARRAVVFVCCQRHAAGPRVGRDARPETDHRLGLWRAVKRRREGGSSSIRRDLAVYRGKLAEARSSARSIFVAFSAPARCGFRLQLGASLRFQSQIPYSAGRRVHERAAGSVLPAEDPQPWVRVASYALVLAWNHLQDHGTTAELEPERAGAGGGRREISRRRRGPAGTTAKAARPACRRRGTTLRESVRRHRSRTGGHNASA